MNTFQRVAATAALAASAMLVAGCSGNGAQAAPAQPTAVSAAPVASTASTATPTPTATTPILPAGIIAKGVANDGKGNYLQTSIADTDPAMQYNPALADAAAKAHFSAADLADAQKVIVRFIAEEAIDSTLNGGNGNIDSWFAAHKDEILPSNQAPMLHDLKANDDGTHGILATENWMTQKPGYSYVHGDNTPRVISRTITPTALRFVENQSLRLQGVMLDTKVAYSMKVTGGKHNNVQNSTGDVSFAVAIDPTDGKWKIAGYQVTYHTTEG